MLVTESGIVTEVKLSHSLKALPSMLVTESPIVTEASLLQPANALLPMRVPLVMITVCKLVLGIYGIISAGIDA